MRADGVVPAIQCAIEDRLVSTRSPFSAATLSTRRASVS